MKKVRECFHMLITAVICLMVSMVPGKNVTAAIAENNVASEILSTRERHVAEKQKLFPYYIGIRKQFLEVLKLFSVEY